FITILPFPLHFLNTSFHFTWMETSQCLVCGIPIFSMHLGLNTCRACSEFFKRVKTLSRKYPCRQGDGRCPIVRAEKLTCRRCRYEKCIAIGMVYDGPLRVRRRSTDVPILQRIKMESKIFTERRREQEMSIINTNGCHRQHSHPTEVVYDVHHSTRMEIYRVFVEESYAFFKQCFPELEGLVSKERELLFKEYIGNLSIVDGYHRTRQIWGETKKYLMSSVMTCYDIEGAYLREGLDRVANGAFLTSCTRNYTDDQNEILLPIFNKCTLTEREHLALLVLSLCEIDTLCISEQALAILDIYRKEILKELQKYYRQELGLNDFSTRLGNLMSLNNAIKECNSLFKVFYRFYSTIFDGFVTENMIKELFL
ncbi:hypothetical protein PMAYCL1PPCAC_15497, partial [Pristionchus mayeri]